ncbi:unnamed protein product [Tuwongella immobilis]|uniref:Uncharacterized protein n=1 Tax=Tuwongella immobilis TaxID=692036 RepID=A0A6C2YY14_9BACT|nr:unnamed protein product [Tuwongella immobilis]VTS08720.1 unnamed protein product [Tuwongella immobilis]
MAGTLPVGEMWDALRERGMLSVEVVWDAVPRPGQGTWKPLGDPLLRSDHFSGRSVDCVTPLTPKNAPRGGHFWGLLARDSRWLTPPAPCFCAG